jgi:glycerol-3-phosphate dehydrogenase (NAD(P)+)
MRIGIIGGGSWGTALAKLLAELDHDVVIWCHNADVARMITDEQENRVYLAEVRLPATLRATDTIADAVRDRELLVAVNPSHVTREVMQQARPHVTKTPYLVSATKGIEDGTLKTMSEVLLDVFGPAFRGRIAALSGPSFAREVAAGLPTAVTAAAEDAETAATVQATFRAPALRVYTSLDLTGVELGGAVKNVIAIAVGVSDGLGLGNSCRAALITRGVAEVARLASKMGADPLTVAGLSCVGDMVLTCTGDLSRNRTVGVRLGRGEKLNDILGSMKMVAEGVKNSVTVCALARHHGVEMPISEQVRLLLHQEKPVHQVLGDLMRRESKPEFWS